MGSALSTGRKRKDPPKDNGTRKEGSKDEGPPSQKQRRMSAEADTEQQQQQQKEQQDDYVYDSNNPLVSLPPDALISVLCRVPSTDHGAVWKTCKKVREAIDSDGYCSERVASGWAEVSTRLVSKEELWQQDFGREPEHDPMYEDYDAEESRKEKEKTLRTYYSDLGQYDETYGYQDIETEIRVDGRVAGKVKLALFPRPELGYGQFHEATDAHSAELQEVGWALCDNRGRPKVRSIKEADTDGSAKHGGFLHVVSVRVHTAYRPSDTTDVVAKALRMALSDPKLNGEWTLATAMSDPNVYMNKEDKRLQQAIDDYPRLSREEVSPEERKTFIKRLKQCSNLDARTFLRVGYKQIPEMVGPGREPCWLFALPRFFAGANVLTMSEAEAIVLYECPELPASPKGADNELLAAVMKACNDRRGILDTVEMQERQLSEAERQLAENERIVAEMVQGYEELLEELRVQEESLSDAMRLREENPSAFPQELFDRCESAAERTRAGTDAQQARVEQMQREVQSTRENFNAQRALVRQTQTDERKSMDEKDEKLKKEVKDLIKDKGASIRSSHALHCASRLRISSYVHWLLDLVPPDEKTDAINDLDANGSTPLQCAVMGLPNLSHADEYHRLIQELLSLGADKNVINPATGVTALGQYRTSVASKDEYSNFLRGIVSRAILEARGDTEEAWRPIHERMEETLMPDRGETDKDRDAKVPVSANNGSDDDSDVGDY
eukprot:CAMPEP_0178691220 /NCGR_PEP_ID=MMETSP0699-20121125/6492_1 /TAXON_ID=265572 /ORGANISM="Extubocellulus spinifer, Strain CCMP396" /LENGTH=727 /DNA_ID=CAMNT_0020336409 /DNA_START=1 /DNA_END=2184 /DNA_ORIENTATION=-